MNDETELTAEAEATEEATQEETPKVQRAAPKPKPKGLRLDDPLNYQGGRRVLRTTTCGWCMDGIHKDCHHELSHFEKLWVCQCDCNVDWVPQDLGSGEIIDEPKPVVAEEDDEVKEPAPTEKPSAPTTVRRKVGR